MAKSKSSIVYYVRYKKETGLTKYHKAVRHGGHLIWMVSSNTWQHTSLFNSIISEEEYKLRLLKDE